MVDVKPNLIVSRPSLVGIGQIRLRFGQAAETKFCRISANAGRCRANLGRNWARCGRHRSIPGTIWPILAEMEQHLVEISPVLGEIGAMLVESGRLRAKFGRIGPRPVLDDSGPTSAQIWSPIWGPRSGQVRSDLIHCWPTRAQFGMKLVEAGPYLRDSGVDFAEVGRIRQIPGQLGRSLGECLPRPSFRNAN